MSVNVDGLHERVFARAPIYDLIFSCLSPRSLTRLAWTCHSAYFAVAEFKARAFNINRHFSRYFTDPITFRSLQARTNTLVSGSNALQFLDRTFYPDSDLDLYTHPGHSLEVAEFLVHDQGYQYAPRESQEDDWREAIGREWDGAERRILWRGSAAHAYPLRSIRAVWTFEKTGVFEECLKVQIIEGRSSPLESILGFHSTCVMNFISSDAAYSLYPVATFENRTTLGMPSARTSVSATAVQKYVKRGWRIYFAPTPNDSSFLLGHARWVGDKDVWMFSLDQTGVKPRPPLSPTSAPLPYDPVRFNGWRLTPRVNQEGVHETQYYPIRSTLFRYNYTLPDEEISFDIREWATWQGKWAHRQVPKEEWTWFDTDIPSFLRKN